MEGYIEIQAKAVNNSVSTLSSSGTAWGDGGDGEQPNTYWLYWSFTTTADGTYLTGGYTGYDWYFNDPNNYLKTGWTNYSGRGNYTNDINGFTEWLAKTNPSTLDDLLGTWPSNTKQAFIDTYYTQLRFHDCLQMF